MTQESDRPENTSVLHVDQLSKAYHSASHTLNVVKKAELKITKGESIAIVGPSGSGKTTLLGLCAGLDNPTSGQVAIEGIPLNGLDENERAAIRNKHVGFIFQNFQLIPTLTAVENIMVPLELRGENPATIREKADQLLEKVELAERADHYPVQLSGGEQQRVAIARAFINEPKILFADEPTGNLDMETGAHVIDLLFELNASAGITLILVTHDLRLAAKANRQFRIVNGVLSEITQAL